MSTLAPRIPLDVPGIPIEHLNVAERQGVEALNQEIMGLKKHADNFYDALMLFDYSHQQLQLSAHNVAEFFSRWKVLAARDGAMTIHFFGKALENATVLLVQYQAALTNIELTKLRSAWTMLVSLVPEFESVGQAGARVGELIRDVHSPERRLSSIPDRHPATADAVLTGRKYQKIYNSKLQSYQINRRTYEGLIAVAKELYSALGHYHRVVVSSQDFFWRVRPD